MHSLRNKKQIITDLTIKRHFNRIYLYWFVLLYEISQESLCWTSYLVWTLELVHLRDGECRAQSSALFYYLRKWARLVVSVITLEFCKLLWGYWAFSAYLWCSGHLHRFSQKDKGIFSKGGHWLGDLDGCEGLSSSRAGRSAVLLRWSSWPIGTWPRKSQLAISWHPESPHLSC